MLIYAQLDVSSVNGPGRRAVLFLQGCLLGCTGCWNPGSHTVDGEKRAIDDIANWIALCRERSYISGLTISGGEPMHQAPELLALARNVRVAIPNLSFGMFSGYSERELDDGAYWTLVDADCPLRRSVWRELRSHLDFAVLGRYNPGRPGANAMISSTNQTLHLYTSRYSRVDFAEQSVEIQIDDTGLTQITGFPILGSPVLD